MRLGRLLRVSERGKWRSWLEKNHSRTREIWLVFYKKHSGKPCLSYSDAVEEALCFGWIDSIVKKVDTDSYAQRFTPRRPGSPWSELNKERLRKLIRQGLVPPFHLPFAKAITKKSALQIAPDIAKALRQDAITWKNFMKFPSAYRRIRIMWVESARSRPKTFKQRLDYFVKMTRINKKYGFAAKKHAKIYR